MKKIFALLMLLVTSPVYAATYFVDCNNGNNTNSGTSHAQAWKTVSKVNSSVNTSGDDVYFKAGCTWNETLTVDWGGSAGNKAIVGSYYMNSGSQTIGVPSGTNNPTFKGTCVSASNCPYNTASSIPSSEWNAMITVKGNYTTVKNLESKNSSGIGIQIYGTGKDDEQYHHNYILDNIVDHTVRNGIFVGRRSKQNVIRGNTVTKAAMAKPYKYDTNWPASIGLAKTNNNVIEKNYIYHSFGESIGVFDKSHYNIVRDNLVVKGNKPGIYVSCSNNNIVENNKVIGDRTDSLAIIKDGYPSFYAYGSTSEAYCNADTKNNIFRNNLAANVRTCFYNTIEEEAAAKGYRSTNNKFYNNNCVNAYIGFSNISNGGAGNAFATFKNNIVTDVNKQCSQVDSQSTVDYNHWDTVPSDADCQGANDITGKPSLNVTTGWNNVSKINIPADNAFDVKSSVSSAINTGTPLTTVAVTSTNYPQIALLDSSCGFDESHNAHDHNCTTRSTPDSIGAFSGKLTTSSSTAIVPPTGLSLSIIPQ